MLLIRNFLVAREPLYGMGEWASRYAPDLLGLDPEQVLALNDDRSGRWLTTFFTSDPAAIGLAATTRSVHQFTELTALQRRLLRLLGIPASDYGR